MTLAINYTDEGRIVYRYLVQRTAGRGWNGWLWSIESSSRVTPT